MSASFSTFGARVDEVYRHLSTVTQLTIDHPRPVLTVASACALLNTLASTNQTLQRLTLDRFFASDRDESPIELAESLARLLLLNDKLTSLTFVNHGFYVGGRFAQIVFDALASKPQQLIELDLRGNYFADGGLAGAMGFLRANTTLRKLDLSCCLIEKLNGALLTTLATHPALEWLHVREARRLVDADRDAMTLFLAHTRVREFDASTGGFDAAAMSDVLRALAACTTLRHFRINCLEPFDDAATDALVELVQLNSTLETLFLFCQTFRAATAQQRFSDAVVANTTLTSLFLGQWAHENPLAALLRRNVARGVVGVALVLLARLPPYVVADIVALVETRQTHGDILRTVCGVQASRQALFTLRPRQAAAGD